MIDELDEETTKQAEQMSKHSPGLTIVAYISKAGKRPSLVGHNAAVDEIKSKEWYKKKRVLGFFVAGKKVAG